MNTTAGKQVGQLSTTYENLKTVKEQANILIQTSQPIVSITVRGPMAGDPSNVANTIAAQLTAEMQADLDADFIAKLEAQITAVAAEFTAQVALAGTGDEPANPEVTP